MHLVRFKGKFTELIPDGWEFQKLFGRNYRQYHKTCDGSEWAQGCRIWQHHGGYLEVEDLFDESWIIVKQIMDGRIKEWESQVRDIFSKVPRMDNVYWLKQDKEKHTFYPWHSDEYKTIMKAQWALSDMPEAQRKPAARAHYDRYREFNMRTELVAMIKGMIDKGWLAIEEVPDPK